MNIRQFLVIALIAGVTAGVSAEFKVGWTFDMAPTLFRLDAPTGDYTEATLLKPVDNNGEMILTEDVNPLYRGKYWEALTGKFEPAGTAWNRGTENRVRLWLTGESYEIYGRLRLDTLIEKLVKETNPSTTSAGTFLNEAVFDDWYARGALRMFRAEVGNYDRRGRTPEYEAGFHEFTRNRQDFFGIHLPNIYYSHQDTAVGVFDFKGSADSTESTNIRFGYKHGANNYAKDGSNPFWLFEAGFGDLIGIPLFFELFGDMANFTRPVIDAIKDEFENTSGFYRYSGGVRISGEKIADLVTFDAMYRIRGGDESSFDTYTELADGTSAGTRQPDGKGATFHHFGAYGNLAGFVDGLGISLGYTGMIRRYEKQYREAMAESMWGPIPARELAFKAPFYSGIDLRANYRGIDKLEITFSNNVSFTKATGTDVNKESTAQFATRIWGADSNSGNTSNKMAHSVGDDTGKVSGVLEQGQTQSWLSLYHALGVNYKLTGSLTGFFNVAYRYGRYVDEYKDEDKNSASPTFNDKNKVSRNIYSGNDLMAVLGLTYALSPFVVLHGGLSVRYANILNTHEGSYHEQVQVRTQDSDLGTVVFAIPLWLRIAF